MSINKIEIQDGSGNVYYPKTSIDSVIYSDNTSIEEKIIILERKLIELKSQLANSINNKTGSSLTSNSTVDEMAAIINSIKTLEQATADANATASNILVDKTAYVNGAKVTGTMPNTGQQTATINAGGKVVISKGYHDGTGYVQSNSMGTQLSNLGATLTSASQLVSGVKAVDKNGNLITGTATIASLGGLELRTGTISINNTNLRDNTYSLQLSQLNLPRTPKFVICNWELTYRRNAQYNKLTEFTEGSYTFFDFINDKCYYPTNIMWSHDNSGTYKIVDTIRNFTNKSILCMHIEDHDRYLIPTIDGYENSNFSRDPMRVFWTAFV